MGRTRISIAPLGEYNIVHLLASNVGRYMTYRAI